MATCNACYVCCCCFWQEATAEELEVIRRLKLHTERNAQGCTALHYAAAAHKVKLVQQLLNLGADVDAVTNIQVHHLTPLHLACMGRVTSIEQMKKLLDASDYIYNLVVSLLACDVVTGSRLIAKGAD
jgi:ankyrin repeat protein